MSFNQKPPKTAYGDQDFIKEDWHPQTPAQSALGPQSPSMRAYSIPSGSQINQNINYSPVDQMPPPVADTSGHPIQSTAMRQFTEEDRLFLQSWRNESFYYRSLPFTLIAGGGLYYFNKMRGRPQKLIQFFLLPLPCYILGVMSYRGELKRRLQKTSLNTPFIQGLRQLTGLRPITGSEFNVDSFEDNFSETYNKPTVESGWNATDISSTTNFRPAPISSYSQPHDSFQDTEHQPYGPGLGNQSGLTVGNQPRTSASYEELRARNRGFIQK